jgi:hypothetical protein
MGGIGQAHGPDAAIAPGLVHEPGAGIVAVWGLSAVFLKVNIRSPRHSHQKTRDFPKKLTYHELMEKSQPQLISTAS